MDKKKKMSFSRRREFLKGAGGTAIALASGARAFAQPAGSQSANHNVFAQDVPADRGIWVTWYDLPNEGRDAYLPWLHGTYLPTILKRPGYLWAAHYAARDLEGGAANATRYKHVDDPKVGKGYHYILLIAAADANVFGDPVPSVLHAALPETGRKMLAMRIGERMNLMTETGRLASRSEVFFAPWKMKRRCTPGTSSTACRKCVIRRPAFACEDSIRWWVGPSTRSSTNLHRSKVLTRIMTAPWPSRRWDLETIPWCPC
jgi:hypothetical protein